jgi:hypothetical protein
MDTLDTIDVPGGLTPAQGRLVRLLRERGAHLIGLPVTGVAFSDPQAARAWGKGVRMDTVRALVDAGVLVAGEPARHGRREFRLAGQAER